MPIADTLTVPPPDPKRLTLTTSGAWYAVEVPGQSGRVNLVNESSGAVAYRVTYPGDGNDATTEVYTIAAGAERLLDLDRVLHGYPHTFHLRGSVGNAVVGITPAVRP